jgi:hypothetical protein
MFDDYGNPFLGNIPQKYLGESVGHFLNKGLKKVISHLPLNNSPMLEGVPLLPSLEDEVEKLADEHISQFQVFTSEYHNKNDFIAGYNKSKEKYKYTEEDMWEIFVRGIGVVKLEQELSVNVVFDQYIQSLQQPKIPIMFRCEIEAMNIDEIREQGKGFLNTNTKKLKTIINSQGLTQCVGEWVY